MALSDWTFEAAEAEKALAARQHFLEFLRAACTPNSDYEAALIVFVELIANVIRHAAGPIQISVRSNGVGGATLQVTDTGAHFVFAPTLPSYDSESGRGLYLVSQLCTEVSVSRSEFGNIVRAHLPVEWGSGY